MLRKIRWSSLLIRSLTPSCQSPCYRQYADISKWRYVADFNLQPNPIADRLYDGVVSGNRAALAQSITLVESTNHRKQAMGK